MNRNKNIVIMLIIAVTVLIVALIGMIVYITVMQKDNSNKTIIADLDSQTDIEDEEDNSILKNRAKDEIDDVAVNTFNAMFTYFEGTNQSFTKVKELLSRINTNNQTRTDDHLIKLLSDGIQKEEEVSAEKKYTIKLFYDSDGYVNEIKITESVSNEETEKTTPGNMEALIFNQKISSYLGEINGEKVMKLLETCQEIMDTNTTHKIAFNSSTLQSSNEITSEGLYIVTALYDTEGYINAINVDKSENSLNLTDIVVNTINN